MGRDDSHYRPESGQGAETGGSPGRSADPVSPGAPSSGASARGRASVPPPPLRSTPDPDSAPESESESTPPAGSQASETPRPPAGPPPADPVPPTTRGRRRLAWLAAVLVLVVGVGAALVLVRPGPIDGWLGGADPATTAAPDPAPRPVLAVASDSAPMPTPAGVKAAIDKLNVSAALGERLHLEIIDLKTGEVLDARAPQEPTVPASVTKLVTAVTVLAARGPAYRIPTVAVAGANPGEVVLVGGGDPTLAGGKTGYYPGAARLDVLAEQVRKALGGTAPTKVIVDGSLYSGPAHEPGWDSDIPTGGYGGTISALMIDGARNDPKSGQGYAERSAEPELAAGRAFAAALGLPASAVSAGRAPRAGAASGAATAAEPAAGAELARVESAPMVRLVELMLEQSDNFLAEALARQVALVQGKPASFAGSGEAMKEVLAELGLPAEGTELADGSGLSRDNRIAPRLLTEILQLAADPSRPDLSGLFAGLPVAAWSGTLRERYGDQARAGAGAVRAKTGTLSGVHAISGVVTTADGRVLAFAILADRVPHSADPQVALDRIAAALAGCGCR